MNVPFNNSTMRSTALVVLSVLAATTLGAALVGAASTISTNISTGGTLTVTGASTLTGAVTMSAAATVGTTLTVSGLVTMEAAATVGTTLGVTGHSTFASASSTQLSTSGNFAAGSTTPWHIRANAIVDGSGTTTLWITSSSAATAGCIQMENSLGVPVRLYVTTATALRVEVGDCK